METKAIGGRIGNVPIGGGFVKIPDGEISSAINSLKGPAIALGILSLLFVGFASSSDSSRIERKQRLSITKDAHVITKGREFSGKCQEGEFKFICDGDVKKVSFSHIAFIKEVWKGTNFLGCELLLTDGTYYGEAFPITKEITFELSHGQEKVYLPRRKGWFIFGSWYRGNKMAFGDKETSIKGNLVPETEE